MKYVKPIILIYIIFINISCTNKSQKNAEVANSDSLIEIRYDSSVKYFELKPKTVLEETLLQKRQNYLKKNNTKEFNLMFGDTIFFLNEKGFEESHYNIYFESLLNTNYYPGVYDTLDLKSLFNNKINMYYPFGSLILNKKSFSLDFKINTQEYLDKVKSFVNVFCNIWNYYFDSLISIVYAYWGGDSEGKGAIVLPKIESTQLYPFESRLSFEKYYSQSLFDIENYQENYQSPLSLLESIYSLYTIYRFPNIENNQVFFSVETTYYGCDNSHLNFASSCLKPIQNLTGYLIILNKSTNHANILPVFSLQCKAFDNYYRFFYITEDKKILIYEGKSIRQKDVSTDKYLDEYKITLNKTHVISVDANNEIVIENINNDKH